MLWWLPGILLAIGDGDWPAVRGPQQSGHASSSPLAEKWPAAGPPVLWSRPLGEGYSSFAVQDGRAVTLYQTAAGQFVICLDADTGETLWETSVGWPFERGGRYPGPRATPTWSGTRLYFADAEGIVGCLDGRTGRRLWQVHLQQDLGGSLPGFGYCCSPTVEAGLVLLPMGGKNSAVIALDAATGEVRWRGGDETGSYAPAMTITHRGEQLVVCSLENVVVCHELQTGRRKWSFPLSSGYDEHSCWPLWQEPYLWISGPFRKGGTLLELTDDINEPVRAVRRRDPLANDIFSSVLWQGAIFGFDVMEPQSSATRSTRGIFRCLDFATGKELWSAGDSRPSRDAELPVTTPGDWPGHCSVIVADGRLVLLNDLGELLLLRASREHCEIQCRAPVLSGQLCWTQPALAHSRLFVRNQSRAVCLYLGPPELLPASSRLPSVSEIAVAPMTAESSLSWLGFQPPPELLPPALLQLRRWNAVCCGLLLLSLLAAVVIARVTRIQWVSNHQPFLIHALTLLTALVVQPVLAAFTPQSQPLLTWPLALHMCFQLLIAGRIHQRCVNAQQSWLNRGRLVLLTLIAVAWVLLCRSQGLIFESAFVCGFAGALPIALIPPPVGHGWRQTLLQVLQTGISFECFFWSSAAVMLLRG